MTTDKKRMWGWLLYDWASQPYSTVLLTFTFAPFFTSFVVGDPVKGQAVWAFMISAVGIVLALSAPVLGAISDVTKVRRPWIVFFSLLYVFGAAGLWWAVPGMENYFWILVLFAIGLLGMELSLVFVNSLIPDITNREDTGSLSGNGFALGYVGGLVLLFIMLLFFMEQDNGKTLIGMAPPFGLDAAMKEGTRLAGPLSALWYVVFMLPFFLWVKEERPTKKVQNVVGTAISNLVKTIRSMFDNVSLGSYMVSSMFYRDALFATYTFGGIYASGVLGWSITQIGIFGIVAGVAAALFTWIGGFLDKKYGPKRVIIACIWVLVVVCVLIVGTSRETFFGAVLSQGSTFPDKVLWVCGVALGAAGGILQAASRTMVIFQTESGRYTESFGIYALAGKATAFLAPGIIGIFTTLTGSQRLGFAPVIILFFIGLAFLFWVQDKRE